MTYSEQTMQAMNKALGNAPKPQSFWEEIDANLPAPLEEFRIEDTCCGKCPIGTTCYVDEVTGA